MFLGDTSYIAASQWQPRGPRGARRPHKEQTSKTCPTCPTYSRENCSFSSVTPSPPQKAVSMQCPWNVITPRISAVNLSKWNCWFWHKEKPHLVRPGLYTIPYIWRGFTWVSLSSHKLYIVCAARLSSHHPVRSRQEKKKAAGCGGALFYGRTSPSSAYAVSRCECDQSNFPLCC